MYAFVRDLFSHTAFEIIVKSAMQNKFDVTLMYESIKYNDLQIHTDHK